MSNKKNILLWDKFVDAMSNLRSTKMRDKKNILLALFLLALVAGLYYPVAKIIRFEFPLVPPAVVRFDAGIYDPYDPFRGRYVAINVRGGEVKLARGDDDRPAINVSSRLYAVIEVDEKGTADIINLAEKPQAGKINLRLERYSVYVRSRKQDDRDYDIYSFSLPFDRFYMNEKLAPEAERAFMQAARSGERGKCQVVVKIYQDGAYSVDGLEIEGLPIHEFLLKMQKEKEYADAAEFSKKDAGRVMSADEEADSTEESNENEGGEVIFVPR